MRTSRGSGVYPVHESDEPDMEISIATPHSRCLTVIKPR